MMEEEQIVSPGPTFETPKVLFMMADYGHDPTGSASSALAAHLTLL